METTNTMATFKATAKEVWQEVGESYKVQAVAYVRLSLAKPAKVEAKDLYAGLPKAWQDRCKFNSFAVQLSQAGRIVRLFEEQAKAGSWPKYGDVVEFVAKQGSIDKALATLTPAKVEPTRVEESPKPAKAKTVEVSAKVEETPRVDKFATIVAMVDELNEVDLKTLAMVVADRLAKFEAKATAKV